jgi:hypothetical protein
MAHKYEVKTVEIDRIYLDNNNPRHDPIDSEPGVIAHLVREESVKQLARHIASIGGTSPLERMGVIPHPSIASAYVSAEGNRRLCALKLLADPDKADTEANKKYFRELAKKLGDTISTMEIVIFPSREAARPWVALRHEGEQDGIGTRPWNPSQKARFNASGESPKNPNIQATRLIDYARRRNLLPREELDKVSVTTITRFLHTQAVRDTLGLRDNKTLTITVLQEEFDHAITRLLTDAFTPGSGVHSRTNSDDRRSYAENLRTEGVAPKTRGQDSVDLDAPLKPDSSPPREKEPRLRNSKSPDDRKTVIPRIFVARINDRILKRLYDELRGLDAGNFSFAATYLLRAVIERMTFSFLEKRGGRNQPELHAKLESMAGILEADGWPANKLKFLRVMANDRNSRYSPDSIGHFVHGGAVPTRENAIKIWDSLEPVIGHVLKEIE